MSVYTFVKTQQMVPLKQVADLQMNQAEILETKKLYVIVQIQNSMCGLCCAGLEHEIWV